MLRKTFLAGLAALSLTSALVVPALAQTAAPAIDQPVSITFYNYNLASAGNGKDATEKLIADFMAANPNVTVVGVPYSAGGDNRIQADMAASQPVDLVQMGFLTLDYARENYGAKALEDMVPASEIAQHVEGMAPNGIKLGQIESKTYGLAYTFSTPVLFYNADLFRAAGLDPETPPQTWADIKTAALAITEKTGKNGFTSGIFGPSAVDWLFQGVVRSNGGEVISRDRKTLKFAEPEAVAAVSMLKDLYESGAYAHMDVTAAVENMAAGNSGMYLQTSALQASLIAGAEGTFELRAAKMPAFGDKPVRPNNSGSALVVLSNDPLKQRAAWELMKFLTSKEGYTVITRDIGYLPLRTDIVDDPAYLGEWVKSHPLVRPNLEQLAVLEPWDIFPGQNYMQIVKTMMDAAEMATFGGMDVESTMRAAQEQAQKLMP